MKSKVKTTHIIVVIIECVLLFIKSILFYKPMWVAGLEYNFSAITVSILIAIFAVLLLLTPRHGIKWLNAIYIITCLLIAVDSVYYSYVSRLPSLTQLGMAPQLINVSETIINLIKPVHIFMICDAPFIILFSANRELIAVKLSRTGLGEKYKRFIDHGIKKTAAFLVFTVLAAGLFTFGMVYSDFEASNLSIEFFCYHTSDIVKSIINLNTTEVIDKEQYRPVDYSDSEYFGIAKDRNVIIIQVEALQSSVIGKFYNGQELTPNLNRLIGEDSIYFDNHYYQIGGGNTADAEFTVNNSLFAPDTEAGYIKYADNDYHGLPYLLKDNGYSGAHAFHNYIGSFWNREEAYPYQGFDSFTSLEDLEQNDMFALGVSDKELFRQTIDDLVGFPEPFYAFYVTASSHHPYGIPLKDREITVSEDDEGTLFGLYLQAINYTDRAIGEFINMLKEEGLYDNSIIVIYGDHYALPNTDAKVNEQIYALTGAPYSMFERFKVPFIINIPGVECNETKHIASGHIDILPTLLCLLGIHNDKTVMFGQNLLEAEEGIVCQQTHLSTGSFISDSIFYQKPYNNIRRNYTVLDRETLQRLSYLDYENISKYAAKRIHDCSVLIENNDIFLD